MTGPTELGPEPLHSSTEHSNQHQYEETDDERYEGLVLIHRGSELLAEALDIHLLRLERPSGQITARDQVLYFVSRHQR